MTKKDYEKIAFAISTISDEKERRGIAVLIGRVFHEDNLHFNARKFYIACGCSVGSLEPRVSTLSPSI